MVPSQSNPKPVKIAVDDFSRDIGRAIVLDDSLGQKLPDYWDDTLLTRRVHRLGGLNDVTVLVYRIRSDGEAQAAIDLAKRLRAPGYYAHIVRGDSMVVVFPKAVFLFTRGDQETIDKCREYGRTLAISDDQMQFELMFDRDHPDQVTAKD